MNVNSCSYAVRTIPLIVGLVLAAPCTSHGQVAEITKPTFRRVSTIAGNGKGGSWVEQGAATQSALSNPFGIQAESDGSLIIASFDTHVVYRLDSTYRKLTRIAGTGKAGQSGRDGDLPDQVQFNQPHEVQVDQQGNIYIADTNNHRVGVVDAETGRWRTIAGSGEPGFSGDEGPAHRAQLNQAYSIALDKNDLFVADLKNHRIRHVDLKTQVISTICGNGEKELPADGAIALGQPLMEPRSLAVDDENLWIVLRKGNSVWRIDREDRRIYHVAGTGNKGFGGDGKDAKQATFKGPKGIAVNPGVALFIADTENHAIRRIDLKTNLVSTVIGGSGNAGFNGDGDAVASRQLARPHGVCLLPNGELLIGDSENHRVRMLER